ncbi:SDR family NAD(P)-dependent oxidoreductase [Streptomyces sp. NPDC001407]|uniref:SDR family NAD(P)-dependent oxidoreductase n=1 Tax=unclassified Streptomyces TaxID=2593676 RepID=UPI0033C842FA
MRRTDAQHHQGTLHGKTAVVTGGNRGLGLAIVNEYLMEGADVVCASRTPGDIKALQDEYPGRCLHLPTDVTEPDSVAEAMRAAEEEFGGLDIVVANAGISRDARVEKLDPADWDAMTATNLKGVFLCTRAAVPYLRRRGGGAIVNVSSALANRVAVGAACYSATKAAVETFTKVTAIELSRDAIRVNAIAPGFLDAGMGRELTGNPRLWESYRKRFALGRTGEAREAARAAVFLASKDASYVNGAVLEVNGGLLWA